ncbi:hypothetical protein [Streptomyces sp. NPDC052291]|uniref:hypothetical protein n=1 Tax=Streptomyces sp. NPDC052291 TaxID=3161011 RepID=UPI003421F369
MTPEPIAATDLFRKVMHAANWRCQCSGQCGQRHARTEGRCPRSHGTTTPLMAGPADPAISDRAAVALSAESLRAWCPGCHTAARNAARRPVPAAQDGLFDL